MDLSSYLDAAMLGAQTRTVLYVREWILLDMVVMNMHRLHSLDHSVLFNSI